MGENASLLLDDHQLASSHTRSRRHAEWPKSLGAGEKEDWLSFLEPCYVISDRQSFFTGEWVDNNTFHALTAHFRSKLSCTHLYCEVKGEIQSSQSLSICLKTYRESAFLYFHKYQRFQQKLLLTESRLVTIDDDDTITKLFHMCPIASLVFRFFSLLN